MIRTSLPGRIWGSILANGFALSLLAIFIIGVTLIRFGDHEFGLPKVGEALIIACVLAATVDLYVKKKLAEEIAEYVGRHSVGFGLPDLVRREIAELLLVPYIRKNYELRVSLSIDPGRPDIVRYRLAVKYGVENLRRAPTVVAQALYLDKCAVRDKKEEIENFFCKTGEITHYDLKASSDGILLESLAAQLVCKGEVTLPPRTDRAKQADTLFYAACETFLVIPVQYSDSFVCHGTTIGVDVIVDAPKEIAVDVKFDKPPAPSCDVPNHWKYSGVLLPGQRIRLVYRRVDYPATQSDSQSIRHSAIKRVNEPQ